MSVIDEQARLSLVAGGGGATSCELCTAQTVIPSTSVVIHHPRGGVVQLAACDWCVQAVRRISAATGGQALFVLSTTAGPPPSVLPAAPRGVRPASLPVFILELTQHIQDSAGINYVVRVFGRERVDSTWEAWLEFVSVGAAIVLTTRVETTQSNREAVAYWATGLEPAYLQGAFARAQREASTTSPPSPDN